MVATASAARVQRYHNSRFACAFLGISRKTLERWCKAGRLEHQFTKTGRYRFQVAWLEAAKREHRA